MIQHRPAPRLGQPERYYGNSLVNKVTRVGSAVLACPQEEAELPDSAPFERLEAWQVPRRFVNRAYDATDAFPTSELYGLTGQIRRAAVSVSANIAEGSARRGPREFRRFLDIALGSLAELRCLLTLADDRCYLSEIDIGELGSMRNTLGRLTRRLYQSQRDACDNTHHK